MKKQFVNPAVRVINYESSMLCLSNQLGDEVPAGAKANYFAPARGAFEEDSSLF